jgi:putative peptidoglycan lipid II flippase
MVPSVIAGSAVQINVFMNTGFAAHLPIENGPTSWLNVAFRLMQLPLGVFGVAVATVTIPVLSRVATDGISAKFRDILGSAGFVDVEAVRTGGGYYSLVSARKP